MARFEGIGLACGKFPSVDVGQNIFGGENTIRQQMRTEAALARAQAAVGVNPQAACDEIVGKCDVALIDESAYFAQLEKTGHPLVCLIRVYSSICEPPYGEYIHYGTTTQDITDTSTMVQLKQAYEVVQDKARRFRDLAAAKARQYRDLVMMGRTNDQQALPITLGFKIASWVDEMDRCLERLEQGKDRIFVGQFFGAVGTLASLEEHGLEIQRRMMEELGLGIASMHWFASRDRLAELVGTLSILTASLGRVGNEIYNEQRSEVNELAEGFRPGKVGSSTMPHKRNPFVPARLATYGRQIRSCMAEILSAMEATNERDVRTLGMESEVLARAFCITDAALDTALDLVEHMEVHQDAIQRNLDLLDGLVFAETVMMHLSGAYGRLEAHEMVYEVAQRAISEHRSFRELLLEDAKIAAILSKDALDKLMDPARYTGLASYFVDQVAGRRGGGLSNEF